MLGLSKNADSAVAPIRIRTLVIGDNGGAGFGAELSVLIDTNALSKQVAVERDRRGWIAIVCSAERIEEERPEQLVVGSELVGMETRSETESLFDGSS